MARRKATRPEAFRSVVRSPQFPPEDVRTLLERLQRRIGLRDRRPIRDWVPWTQRELCRAWAKYVCATHSIEAADRPTRATWAKLEKHAAMLLKLSDDLYFGATDPVPMTPEVLAQLFDEAERNEWPIAVVQGRSGAGWVGELRRSLFHLKLLAEEVRGWPATAATKRDVPGQLLIRELMRIFVLLTKQAPVKDVREVFVWFVGEALALMHEPKRVAPNTVRIYLRKHLPSFP